MEEWIAKIWSFIGLFTLLQNILPQQLRQILMKWWEFLQDYVNPRQYHLDIPQFKDTHGFNANDLYENVECYLDTLDGIVRARRLTVFRGRNSINLGLCPARDEVVEDYFRGARVWWTHSAQIQEDREQGNGTNERRRFTLRVAQADRHFLSGYFSHITKRAAEFNALNNELTLYTNTGEARWGAGWTGVPFRHPSTFASLALEPLLKTNIIADLDNFRRGKEFYRRIGRSWKRGYLLHGPPGTGKSSLVAAIANYMRYDVYDLELTQVSDNAELRALMTQTKEKSVIIIEDIDCSLNVTERLADTSKGDKHGQIGSKVTLSGLLNFTDGLWSCCGEERIIVFTTNHKDMLDPALLRCGRMDMHILLSFCTFPAFKSLAFNYLQIDDHPLFPAVEEKMESGAQMTAAEIIEVLMKKVEDPCEALNDVIRALDAKKKEKEALPPSTSPQSEEQAGEEGSQAQNARKNSQKRCSRKKRGKCSLKGGRRTESYIFN